jgi:predicted DNA-binding protein (UPF0251 family)
MNDPSDDPRHSVGGAESWRSWLMSGSSGRVADPRRAIGSHRGLKRMLIEGVPNGGPYPESWRHFSGAMVRLAINDALNALPSEETRVVWLAYFAGLSNKEIARQLDLSVAAVQRRLKRALAGIAEHIERGRSIALGWMLMVVGGRTTTSPHRVSSPLADGVRTMAAMTAGVAAAAVLAVPPEAPATLHRLAPLTATTAISSKAPASSHTTQNLPAFQAPVNVTVPSRPGAVSVPGAPALSLPPLPKLPLPPLPKVALSASLKKLPLK